jgi:hypothetical protein
MATFKKEIANHQYEITDTGLFFPKSKVHVGGVFNHWINNDLSTLQKDHNIVVDEGLTYILDTALSAGTQITNFYIGIFKNNYNPLAASIQSSATASNNFVHSTKADEATTEYSESTRPAWTDAGVTSKTITNVASPAVFTIGTNVTIYGAFLVGGSGSSTKGSSGTSQKLIAASQFGSARSLLAVDVLNITYQLQIADA